ncbi:MAG: hypothetical protein EOP10_15620 [Proteobacteria bacterium]|nr:MAG: hypothetical protein EOP10_15620 [Pseudomonadota bacterium]
MYSYEDNVKSYRSMAETMIPYLLSLYFIFTGPTLLIQLLAMMVFALMNVRFFTLFHDFAHGALFRAKTPGMKAMRVIMEIFGFSVLLTKEIWAEPHNRHHQYNSRLDEFFVGQIPVSSTAKFLKMTRFEKFYYLFFRLPFVIPFGYVISCLLAVIIIIQKPKPRVKILAALAYHFTVLALIYKFAGVQTFVIYISGVVLGLAFIKYLFNLQHVFPGAHYYPKEEWSMVKASLHTTSFLRMSRLGHWITANIGYHHVHHMSPKIPFYNLPLAMEAIPELQNPFTIGWHPRSVLGVLFGAAAWDQDNKTMISFGKLYTTYRTHTKPIEASNG